MGPGFANSPERKRDMSKVSELLDKRIYGFATTGANWLNLPRCRVFTTVLSTDMQQSGCADNMCCFSSLVSQIFVQRSALEHSVLQRLQKRFGWTLPNEKPELKCWGLAKMVLLEMELRFGAGCAEM